MYTSTRFGDTCAKDLCFVCAVKIYYIYLYSIFCRKSCWLVEYMLNVNGLSRSDFALQEVGV